MSMITNAAIDATIDSIEVAALAAYCARIDTDDDSGSAPPCTCDEPEITPHEWSELQREITMVIAATRSTRQAERPA